MANPLFPDVPNFPGVPAVFRNATNPGDTLDAPGPLTQDSPGVGASSRALWGIYDQGGNIALECDSVIALEPSREFRISDYPVEKGGFQSFNKVATPAETRITVTKGGSDVDRQGFIDTLETLIGSTDLFNIVTPDNTYSDRNLIRYDFRRTADRGVTLLTVDIVMLEVRQTATAQFSDSKQPSGDDASNNGPVQAEEPAATELPAAASPASTNPNIVEIPPLTASSTIADKAATVAGVIQNGGSIGDLVNKGVSFLKVPVVADTAQQLTCALNGQRVAMNIYQKATGLFADISVNDNLILSGVMARNDVALVHNSYLGLLGDLYFHDTAGTSEPTYQSLGGRHVLLYAGA